MATRFRNLLYMAKRRKEIRKQIIGENLIYAMVWSVVFLIPIMNAKLMSEEHVNFANVVVAWIKIAPYFGLFLINNRLLIPYQLDRRKYAWYLLTAILLLSLTFGAIEVYEQWRISIAGGYAGEYVRPRHASLTDLQWYWNIFLGIFMFGVNVGIKMLYKSMQDDEDKERLIRQNIQAEMTYLKYQINPHFLMNTLNNIHALIDIEAESAKRCLIELSGMMRYVVYESNTDDIPLRRDVAFLESYIELMRIRYAQPLDICFNYPRDLSSSVVVPPLVFIVFVENAFKHGVSYSHPSYIHIDISVNDTDIEARFINSSHYASGSEKQSTGIGLDNVRKRLDLIYGNRYELEIDNSIKDRYSVTLKIPKTDDKGVGN